MTLAFQSCYWQKRQKTSKNKYLHHVFGIRTSVENKANKGFNFNLFLTQDYRSAVKSIHHDKSILQDNKLSYDFRCYI